MLRNSSIFYHRRGQLIIESLVAMLIITTGLLGIFSLLARSIASTRTVSAQYIGTHLAAEGIELVKNMIDNNAIGRARTNNASPPWNQGIGPGQFEIDYLSGTPLTPVVAGAYHFLNFDPVMRSYSYKLLSPANPSIYQRLIDIKWLSAKEIQVTSTVFWSLRGSNYSVSLEDHFFDWRP